MPLPGTDGVQPDWIAVDWGTTHLRVWAMQDEVGVLASASSDKGMGTLQPDQFEHALLELVSGWLSEGTSMQVLACGMVGARQGWREADYLPVPTAPLVPDRFERVPCEDARLAVSIIPGLKQQNPPDVMRGEETQIAGFLAQNPDFEGTLCMPGTHTKWAQISSGKVETFCSYMTGELYALLQRQSVLRHSLAGEGVDPETFKETLAQVLEEPRRALSGLFRLRAEDLLSGAKADDLRAKLSGYLIGSEIIAARAEWTGRRVALIGTGDLNGLYGEALKLSGGEAELHDAAPLTLEGLCAARSLLIKGGA